MDRAKYLSLDEVRRLRDSTAGWAALDLQHGRRQGPLAWLIVDLALSTGLRVSEIAAITLADIDAKRLTITVTRVKKKTRKPESLAIGKALADHLAEYIAHQRKDNASTRLLIGKKGPLTAQGLQVAWKRAVAKAGLPVEVSIHCGRHTLATALFNETHNAKLVQRQLGHSSVATTLMMYCGVSEDQMRDALSNVYEPKETKPLTEGESTG